jgi:hypothetical protein
MAARPKRTTRTKALRLAYWNADGICGKKEELYHFLGQHGIDICLLAVTHLRSGDVFRLVNYVCHRPDRLSEGGGTAILVRRGIEQHAVPIQGLQYLEATAIQVMLANRPAKILAVYLSPSRLLIDSDLSACLDGSLPVVMAGDLNAKHVEWNSRLTTNRGRLSRDYADRHSCVIHGPETPITVPYNPSATHDVLDTTITKGLVSPMHLTACPALSS